MFAPHEVVHYFNYTRFIYSGLHFVPFHADPPLILFASDNQKTELSGCDVEYSCGCVCLCSCVCYIVWTRIHCDTHTQSGDFFGMRGHFDWSSQLQKAVED